MPLAEHPEPPWRNREPDGARTGSGQRRGSLPGRHRQSARDLRHRRSLSPDYGTRPLARPGCRAAEERSRGARRGPRAFRQMAVPDAHALDRASWLVPDEVRFEDRGNRLEQVQDHHGRQQRRAQVQRRLPPDPLRQAGAARGAGRLAGRALRERRTGLRPARHRPRPHDLPRLQLLGPAPAFHRRRRRRPVPRRESVQGAGGETYRTRCSSLS